MPARTHSLLRREVLALLRLASPIIVGKLCLMGENTMDVVLAGHLSASVLGAVAMGSAAWWLAYVGLSGLMMAVSPIVSQLDGAGQRSRVGASFAQSLWIALGAGILLIPIVRWGGPLLVAAMGVTPALRTDVTLFLHAISWAAPATGILTACMGLSEGLSMPRPTMVFGGLGLLLLAPLGFVLMYGRLGFPAMGAEGSGIANAIVIWAQAAGFLAWISLSGRFAGIGWRWSRAWPQVQAIAGQLRIGGAIAASQLLESGLFSTAGLIIGGFGTAAAASHLLALNVAALVFMIPLGVAFATTVRVGNGAGRHDRAAVRRSGFCGIGLAVTAQTVAAVALLAIPRPIAEIYTNDPEVISRATILLRLAAVYLISDGFQVAAIAALRGVKDTAVPVAITAVAYWGVGMPIALLCAYPLGLEAPGIWYGLIAALAAAALLLVARFERISRA